MRNLSLNLIDEILKCEQDFVKERSSTYFEIIGRSYDEDLISRMLAYTLGKDDKLICRFIEESGYSPAIIVEKSVRCEKSLPGGRIDIFVELQDSYGQKYTLTIENKVNSLEHGDQTQIYYDYIQKNYNGNIKNLYYYLKPVYNAPECSCGQFKTITYSNLCEWISDCADGKIVDFKNHIKKYFCGVKNMNDIQRKILENYGILKHAISETETVYESKKQALFGNIAGELKVEEKGWKTEITSMGDSYRIYKNEWYHDDSDKIKKYYFYAELLYVGNDPNRIFVQGTAKTYGTDKKNRTILKFVEDYFDRFKPINEGAYYIFYQSEFKSEQPIYSEKWESELKEFSIKHIEEAIDKIDEVFNMFLNHIKK